MEDYWNIPKCTRQLGKRLNINLAGVSANNRAHYFSHKSETRAQLSDTTQSTHAKPDTWRKQDKHTVHTNKAAKTSLRTKHATGSQMIALLVSTV